MKKVFLLCMTALLCAFHGFAEDFDIQGDVLVKYNGAGGRVTIPSGVIRIGENAFWECNNLTSVSMPSVTSIGQGAFSGCGSLTSASMPLVTDIGSQAFFGCSSFISVSMPLITSIGKETFYECSSLTSVSMPLVTDIGQGAFFGCSSLTSVSMPSVTSIGDVAFYECSSLASVSKPLVTDIGRSAFLFCTNLSSVSMPLVTDIGYCAFGDCSSLTSVSMPLVTSIGEGAFAGCSSLTSVLIPASVTVIESIAFANCISLKDLTVEWLIPFPLSIHADVFYGCNMTACILHVPLGTEALYRAAPVWKDFFAELTVSPANLDFTAVGGLQNISVTSNVAWTASSSASWATVSPSSGTDNETVSIMTTANTGNLRTATVTINGNDVVSQTVNITQVESGVSIEIIVPDQEMKVFSSNGILSVNTPAAERVDIYSFTGAPVFSAVKAAGTATFTIGHLHEKTLIVRGSSGWTRKIANVSF
jgi:hypothetical protein